MTQWEEVAKDNRLTDVSSEHENSFFNPLNADLNPICCLLALLGAHHFLHVSRIRVKSQQWDCVGRDM